MEVDDIDFDMSFMDEALEASVGTVVEWDEEVNGIDPRLKYLSYSSLKTLHSCPRKFELEKKTDQLDDLEVTDQNVTFAFGHTVGIGVQSLFEGKALPNVLMDMFMMWRLDIFAENEKKGKSFWLAIQAIKYLEMQMPFFSEYELVYYMDKEGNHRPAIELGSIIACPDGFFFRGYIDVVLRHKLTGEITVIEVKTTGSREAKEAEYRNSAQALGYSVVLDSIVPGHSSYQVIYLVYSSTSQEWEILPFEKTLVQRARWIQDILLDIERIKMYHNVGYYPMYGESCFEYFRECQFYGSCHLDNKYVTRKLTQKVLDDLDRKRETFDIHLTIHDLIQTQMSRHEELTNG